MCLLSFEPMFTVSCCFSFSLGFFVSQLWEWKSNFFTKHLRQTCLTKRPAQRKGRGPVAGTYLRDHLFLRGQRNKAAGSFTLTCLGGVLEEQAFHQLWTEKTLAWWTNGDGKIVHTCAGEVACIILNFSPHILAIRVLPRSTAAVKLWVSQLWASRPRLSLHVSHKLTTVQTNTHA